MGPDFLEQALPVQRDPLLQSAAHFSVYTLPFGFLPLSISLGSSVPAHPWFSFFLRFIYFRAANPHPHSVLSCNFSCLPLFFPPTIFSLFLSLIPFSFSYISTVSSLSLSFCFLSLQLYNSAPFLSFLPAPRPLPPSLSCSPGSFTDKSPASRLIISNASRLRPHPPHSN